MVRRREAGPPKRGIIERAATAAIRSGACVNRSRMRGSNRLVAASPRFESAWVPRKMERSRLLRSSLGTGGSIGRRFLAHARRPVDYAVSNGPCPKGFDSHRFWPFRGMGPPEVGDSRPTRVRSLGWLPNRRGPGPF